MLKSDKIERLIRSRFLRLAFSVALIAMSAWAFLPYVAYRVASSAFVNAELMRVTAPITGQLSRDLPRKGTYLDGSRTVKLIEAYSPDRRQLMSLDQEYAIASEHAELARAHLAEIAAMDQGLAERTEAYRHGMIERLARELEEMRAERSGCLAEMRQRRDVGTRLERLVQSGIASRIRSAEAFATSEATSTRCDMAEARIQRLEIERTAAESGVFLRDGANDVPYSQQQRDRLTLRRQELQVEALRQAARATQLAAEIAEERRRLDRLTHYDLALPAAHVVWSMAASPGSAVTEGQTVVDFADCQRRFVVVELAERDFETIKAGDPAAIRLIGSDDWMRGQVQQVRGSAAHADERLLAAQVPSPAAGSVTVEVALPPDAPLAERNNFCNIGRLAEVRFQRSSLGLAGGLGHALRSLFGGVHERIATGPMAGR